jgi:hypothetical protein
MFMDNEDKDIQLLADNPWYMDLEPLKKCICGGMPHIDVSMALIQCDNCKLSFEYRYNKGIIPYHTWQAIHK